MDADRIRRSIDETSRELLIHEPYFGHLLVGTVRAASDGDFVTRLTTTGHTVRLQIGAALWSALSPARARRVALKHELLHLTFKHPLRARDFALLDLYGLACDLVVNQFLDSSDLVNPVTLADFAELHLPENGTADDYYARLLPLYEQCASDCNGADGSCEGAGNEAENAMRRWLGGCAACRSHSSWSDFARLPSSALSVLECNVDMLVEATVRRARCRGWGLLPSGLVQLLEGLIDGRSEVPWRRILRLFGTTSERTYIKSTIARPSKRYGTCPGIRVRRKTDIVVAVDTSGSVAIEEIATFFSEIHSMWRRGAHVVVVECDAAIAREYPYRGVPPKKAAGRGGTSFDPAIARANELRPDALIYFTDGDAPKPTVRARMPLLWVITSQGRALDDVGHLPGRRVKLRGL